MSELLDQIKPQLDAMHEMYRAGYAAGLAEGRRQANAEFALELKKIQEAIPPTAKEIDEAEEDMSKVYCCQECEGHEKVYDRR